jgi:hypothetical protein
VRPIEDDYQDYEDADFDPRYQDSADDDPRFDYRRSHQPPPRRSQAKRWLIILGLLFVGLPLSCCGGLLFWSTMFKEFKLSNGQHMGGTAMNLKFDYEVKTRDRFLSGAYSIVAETYDGITRDRPLPRRFDSRGTFFFNALDAGPAEKSKSPVKVWIEKETFQGGRGKASNVISIEIKTN